MKNAKYLALMLLAAAACKSSSGATDKAGASKAVAASDDPWASKRVDAKDIKDPDLARLVELAQHVGDSTAYPQADAVVALDRDDVTLKTDGTVVTHHKSIVKLLDPQRGKEKFADVHIPYDTKRQTLTIDVARTVNSDGAPHAAAPEEIGDIVPPQLADATIYSDVRERVVSFPAVDKGSVVELEYTRTTKATPDSALGGEQMLGQWDPVLERTVTITAPSGVTPTFAVDGTKLAPTEHTAGDGKVWTFELKNQPDQHPENDAPVDAAVLPRLVYSFQPSWEKVLQPVAERFLRAALPQPLPPAIKQEADRVIGDASTDADKAARLYAFVAHDIRSVELPLGWAGYEPHAPDVVLANRYADERDKVGLLLAMASAEGIAGQPVFVRTGMVPVISTVPTVAQFDRVLAKLSLAGKDVWCDPTDENGQYGIAFAGQDNFVLPLEKGGKELGRRPALDPSTSVSHTTATFALGANGDLDATYNYELSGWYADRASAELRPLKGERLDKFFQQGAVAVAASAIDKGHDVGDMLSVRGPITAKHHVSAAGYATAQGNMRVFELPAFSLGVAGDTPSAGLTERKYPMQIGVPRTESEDVTVNVPAGWKVAYVPPKLDGTADGIAYSSTCEANGQTVTCHEEIKLDKLVLPTAKYGAFRDALNKLEAYERRVVLLTKA